MIPNRIRCAAMALLPPIAFGGPLPPEHGSVPPGPSPSLRCTVLPARKTVEMALCSLPIMGMRRLLACWERRCEERDDRCHGARQRGGGDPRDQRLGIISPA